MMIQHEHVHATTAQPGDGVHGGGAAIHGKQERRRKFVQAILHAGLAEAIAFVHAMGEIGVYLPAECGEHLSEERGGSNAVHVVIAEDDERFVPFARGEEPFDGGTHIREQKRIGEVFQAWLQEARDRLRFAEPAVEQALGEQQRELHFLREKGRQRRLRWGDRPAVFHYSNQRRMS
jgi:hypothetical protein